jgi:uncharacterized membrane protein
MERGTRFLFAVTMTALGALGLIHGDFALVWQRIPVAHLPGRTAIAYACGAMELAIGIGLAIPRTLRLASAVFLFYMALWVLLLKLPAVIAAPRMEATWLGFGEIAVVAAGAWVLFIRYAGSWEREHLGFVAGRNGLRNARLLFILCLPMIGLAHFFYAPQTAAMVPGWLPYRLGWAWLTGAGSLAAALALLFEVVPFAAATTEAAMMSVITLLVWGLGIVREPMSRLQWTGFWISTAFTAACWTIATTYRRSSSGTHPNPG